MSPLVDQLRKDRFPEFQQLAESKGSLANGTDISKKSRPSLPSAANANLLGAGSAGGSKNAFMRDFFEATNSIQNSLNQGKTNVKLMGSVLEDALQATTQQKEKEVSDRLNKLVEETSDHVTAAKQGLDELRARAESEEGKKCSAAEAKIQKNMQQSMTKKHQTLILDFQHAQTEYKAALEQRQSREMQILMPELTEEERRDMIDAGETTSLIVAKKMAGAHALLLDEVQRVRDKHQDILRLEQNIHDLCSMFQEVAALVDSQGEMLDAIEIHVHKTKDCTEKAEKNLITTRKIQHKTRKQMCCLTAVMMVVAIVILAPVLLKQ